MNQSAIIRTQKEKLTWKALSTGCLAHFIHDGFTDMIYVFFPIWQAQWALTFVEVGLLKTLVSGSMAMFQLPAGIVASRIGQVKLLLIGTIITSVAVMLWGFAISPVLLGLLLILGGLGSSVQHPVSSSIIADAYSDIKAPANGIKHLQCRWRYRQTCFAWFGSFSDRILRLAVSRSFARDLRFIDRTSTSN